MLDLVTLLVLVAGFAVLLVGRLCATFDFVVAARDFADFATRVALLLLAAFAVLATFRATLREAFALAVGLRLDAPLLILLALLAFAARAFVLLDLRTGIGAAAFKRFSKTGVVSSSPATRARAAPSDRAGAEIRGDGNAAPAADLLAFVFMAINVWGWQ